jgi:hypothetical protein
MGPDDGWRYHDPHQWGSGMQGPGMQGPGMHHHGPPPWVDGPDAGWSILPALFPLLMVLWVLYRWYALDLFAERARDVRAARAARRDTVRTRWAAAVARYGRTAQAYAAFECDPVAVLHRPALADVTEAATSRFVDAFADATALATDAYPGAEAGERFVVAAERADRAWRAAVDAADRVRAARFAPGERALIDQVLALLALARSSPHEAERRSAYERARRRLADLERSTGWAMPRAAGELLAIRARGELRAA